MNETTATTGLPTLDVPDGTRQEDAAAAKQTKQVTWRQCRGFNAYWRGPAGYHRRGCDATVATTGLRWAIPTNTQGYDMEAPTFSTVDKNNENERGTVGGGWRGQPKDHEYTVCSDRVFRGSLSGSQTELQITQLQITRLITTQLWTTQLWTTELWMTDHDTIYNDPTLTTQLRIQLNFGNDLAFYHIYFLKNYIIL